MEAEVRFRHCLARNLHLSPRCFRRGSEDHRAGASSRQARADYVAEGPQGFERCVVTGFGDDRAADVGGDRGELPVYLVSELGLAADGENRAADRIGVVRPILLGLDQPRAVHLEDGSGGAGLHGRPHHLVDASLSPGRRDPRADAGRSARSGTGLLY